MGFFSRRKKDDFIDLTEKYRKQQEKITDREKILQNDSEKDSGNMGFFGAIANTVSSAQENPEDSEEKRRRLSKRLIEITNKIEELSNQIYHLQQRVELLERKMNVNKF
jgi:chromosome segregation ATPase